MTEPNIVGGLIGGALIGAASVLLLWSNGRVAGVSGIVGELVVRRPALWRVLFVAGLVLGGLLWIGINGELPQQLPGNTAWLFCAGLVVGLGTGIGSGCTSGHGVCGLARRSRRSLAATATFMATAIVTVAVTSHL